MGDEGGAFISGTGHRQMVTSSFVRISGTDNSVNCSGETTEINLSGNDNHCTFVSGTPNLFMRGNDNSIKSHSSAGQIKISGNDNKSQIGLNSGDLTLSGNDHEVKILGNSGHIKVSGNDNKSEIGLNSGDLTLSGNDHEIIVIGNSGHVTVTGNDISIDITGDVSSITLTGNDHNIRVGGSCLGEIRIGAMDGHQTQESKSRRNRITIGGILSILRMSDKTYRNKIQSQWIESIEMNGKENRVKTNYGNLVDHGELNVIDAEADLEAVYNTPEEIDDNANVVTSIGNSIVGAIINGVSSVFNFSG